MITAIIIKYSPNIFLPGLDPHLDPKLTLNLISTLDLDFDPVLDFNLDLDFDPEYDFNP